MKHNTKFKILMMPAFVSFCFGVVSCGEKPSSSERETKTTTKTEKKIEYQDNTDRIEVERRFSLTKRCYGMGRIMTRLEDTQLASIALSVFVANIVRMQQRILSTLFYLLDILKFQEDWLPACAG